MNTASTSATPTLVFDKTRRELYFYTAHRKEEREKDNTT